MGNERTKSKGLIGKKWVWHQEDSVGETTHHLGHHFLPQGMFRLCDRNGRLAMMSLSWEPPPPFRKDMFLTTTTTFTHGDARSYSVQTITTMSLLLCVGVTVSRGHWIFRTEHTCFLLYSGFNLIITFHCAKLREISGQIRLSEKEISLLFCPKSKWTPFN